MYPLLHRHLAACCAALILLILPTLTSTADGDISTVAGNGTFGFSGDAAAATAAQLNNPHDVVIDTAVIYYNFYLALANSVL